MSSTLTRGILAASHSGQVHPAGIRKVGVNRPAGSNPAAVVYGDLAERTIAPASKAGDQETGPGVRITQSPLIIKKLRQQLGRSFFVLEFARRIHFGYTGSRKERYKI